MAYYVYNTSSPLKDATFYNKCVHVCTYFVSQFISLIRHLGGQQFLRGQRMTTVTQQHQY